MMKFRQWVQELWFEHKEEYEELRLPLPEKDIAEYWNQYKYWLKREYRYQMTKENSNV